MEYLRVLGSGYTFFQQFSIIITEMYFIFSSDYLLNLWYLDHILFTPHVLDTLKKLFIFDNEKKVTFVALSLALLSYRWDWFSDLSNPLSSPSDHGPSVRCDRGPRGPAGGPAERSLGGSARPQRLPVSGQIPDPLQAGRQPGLEGKEAADMLGGRKSALAVLSAQTDAPLQRCRSCFSSSRRNHL